MLNMYPLFLFFPNAPCQPHLSNKGNELDFDFKTIAGTNNDRVILCFNSKNNFYMVSRTSR